MFTALKKKALSKVEQLTKLDNLCDDKQREAAAADAAVVAMLAQMSPPADVDPGFALPLALPVSIPSLFTPAPSSKPSSTPAPAQFSLPPLPPSPTLGPSRGRTVTPPPGPWAAG